jgi:hypothetical protein
MDENYEDDPPNDLPVPYPAEAMGYFIDGLIETNPMFRSDPVKASEYMLAEFNKRFRPTVDGDYLFSIDDGLGVCKVVHKRLVDETVMSLSLNGLLDLTVGADGNIEVQPTRMGRAVGIEMERQKREKNDPR